MNFFWKTILDFLGHPAFQGIGAIAGIISIFVSVWLAQNPSLKLKKITIPRRNIIQGISFILPIYSIFVVSIVFVNIFTKNSETLLYGSVALASILGTGWGFVWATYIQKAFLGKK